MKCDLPKYTGHDTTSPAAVAAENHRAKERAKKAAESRAYSDLVLEFETFKAGADKIVKARNAYMDQVQKLKDEVSTLTQEKDHLFMRGITLAEENQMLKIELSAAASELDFVDKQRLSLEVFSRHLVTALKTIAAKGPASPGDQKHLMAEEALKGAP